MRRFELIDLWKNYGFGSFMDGYNNLMGTFAVKTAEIAGLSAKEIVEKLTLPKIQNKVVEVEVPPSTPLGVSIFDLKHNWETISGDVQFEIKGFELTPQWFINIRDLE